MLQNWCKYFGLLVAMLKKKESEILGLFVEQVDWTLNVGFQMFEWGFLELPQESYTPFTIFNYTTSCSLGKVYGL